MDMLGYGYPNSPKDGDGKRLSRTEETNAVIGTGFHIFEIVASTDFGTDTTNGFYKSGKSLEEAL
jgi:hypothetical protein